MTGKATVPNVKFVPLEHARLLRRHALRQVAGPVDVGLFEGDGVIAEASTKIYQNMVEIHERLQAIFGKIGDRRETGGRAAR
jgi:hypothetical protein